MGGRDHHDFFRGRPWRESMVRKEREIDLKTESEERDSMYVDPMNTEGFGERDDLERDPWRERVGELDIWKLQGLVYLARIVKET